MRRFRNMHLILLAPALAASMLFLSPAVKAQDEVEDEVVYDFIPDSVWLSNEQLWWEGYDMPALYEIGNGNSESDNDNSESDNDNSESDNDNSESDSDNSIIGNDNIEYMVHFVLGYTGQWFSGYYGSPRGEEYYIKFYKVSPEGEEILYAYGSNHSYKWGDKGACDTVMIGIKKMIVGKPSGRISEPGRYRIFIPKGNIGDNKWRDMTRPDEENFKTGRANPDLTYYFNISGTGQTQIEKITTSIGGGEKDNNVYGLTGTLVKKDAKPQQIQDLAPGTYVYRGQIIIKH